MFSPVCESLKGTAPNEKFKTLKRGSTRCKVKEMKLDLKPFDVHISEVMQGYIPSAVALSNSLRIHSNFSFIKSSAWRRRKTNGDEKDV
jgi:hypothetical protein